MSLARTVSNVSRRYGATYTLRRAAVAGGANSWTQGAVTPSYVTCTARERGYKPNEIRGGIQERDALIVVDASTLAAAPKDGDLIALGTFTADAGVDWRQIVNVYAPRENGIVRTYRLQVRR